MIRALNKGRPCAYCDAAPAWCIVDVFAPGGALPVCDGHAIRFVMRGSSIRWINILTPWPWAPTEPTGLDDWQTLHWLGLDDNTIRDITCEK